MALLVEYKCVQTIPSIYQLSTNLSIIKRDKRYKHARYKDKCERER